MNSFRLSFLKIPSLLVVRGTFKLSLCVPREGNIGEVPVRAEGFKSHIQTINSIFFQPLSSGRCPSVSPLYC